MPRVKICGLTREEDIAYANALKPDYVGFVFAPSKRQIAVEEAIKLIEKLDKNIKKVGVFVNAPMEEVRRIAAVCKLDVLQFHGEEKPQEITDFPQEVWKSFRIKDRESYQQLEAYTVGGYLLDTYVKGQQGGTGKAFDWNIDSDICRNKFIILAGGLSSENIEEALEKMNPQVVDVSSGVETDGYKDFEKIKKFIEKVRRSYDS